MIRLATVQEQHLVQVAAMVRKQEAVAKLVSTLSSLQSSPMASLNNWKHENWDTRRRKKQHTNPSSTVSPLVSIETPSNDWKREYPDAG